MVCMEHFDSMEDKMAAGAFGRATNYGCDGPSMGWERSAIEC